VTDDPTVGGGEPHAGDDEQDRENKGSDEQPWRRGEQPYAETAEQGGQPSLGPPPGAAEPGR